MNIIIDRAIEEGAKIDERTYIVYFIFDGFVSRMRFSNWLMVNDIPHTVTLKVITIEKDRI